MSGRRIQTAYHVMCWSKEVGWSYYFTTSFKGMAEIVQSITEYRRGKVCKIVKQTGEYTFGEKGNEHERDWPESLCY